MGGPQMDPYSGPLYIPSMYLFPVCRRVSGPVRVCTIYQIGARNTDPTSIKWSKPWGLLWFDPLDHMGLVHGFSYEPPNASLKGSDLWALILKMVYNGVVMGLEDSEVGAHTGGP